MKPKTRYRKALERIYNDPRNARIVAGEVLGILPTTVVCDIHFIPSEHVRRPHAWQDDCVHPQVWRESA
jgi:hypothetical protein